MKKIGFMLFICLLAFTSPALAHEVSLQNGLSFDLPPGWQVEPSRAGALFYAQNSEKPDARMAVINLRGMNPSQAQIRQLQPDQLALLKESLEKLRSHAMLWSRLELFEQNRLVFLRFSGRYLKDEQERVTLQLIYYNQEASFVVSFEFLAASQDALVTQLKQIISSLELNPD